MAIIFNVETGTAETDSTAYLTVDELKQYWDNIGYDYSSLTEDILKQYINRSSKIIDNSYMKQFTGVRTTQDQSMEWPRIGSYYADGWWIDSDTIPKELKNAVSEMVYAILINTADVQPVDKASTQIIAESVKVDVIEESKKYSTAKVEGMVRDKVTAVEDALKRLIPGVGTSSGLPVRL
jgi:hypothetical protein